MPRGRPAGGAVLRRDVMIYLVLALVTGGLFLPLINHDFVNFDDPSYVTENVHVQGGLTWRGVAWAFKSSEDSNWHPLTWISLMLDDQFYGLKPWGYHITNILLHMANTLLLFGVLRLMTGTAWRSAIVAGLFGWHPMHVESIAWVAERKDVLCAFFWLLTIWAYASHAKKPGVKNYALCLLCFILALLSKPMAVTLPFVLLLLDYWPFQRIYDLRFTIYEPNLKAGASPEANPLTSARTGGQKRLIGDLIVEKTPFFALTAASCAVTYFVQSKGGAVNSLQLFPFSSRLANLPIAYASYILKLLWPANLAVLYPLPQSWPPSEIAGASLLILGISALVFGLGRRLTALPVGWLWFLGTLVPVIGLVQVGSQAIADRYSYIPSIGFFIVVVWGTEAVMRERGVLTKICGVVAAGAMAVYCLLTHKQLRYWQNGLTVFEHAVKVTENNGYAYTYLADAQIKAGRFQEGIDNLHEAWRLQPRNPEVPSRIGAALAGHGDVRDAILFYRRALEIDPNFTGALNNLAWILASNPDASVRNGPEAVILGERACDATHYTVPTMVGTLAAAYAEAGLYKEAVDTAEKARELALADDDEITARKNEELMRLYQSGKPFHEAAP
jgi:Tfp pilus assembly protein PilF